MCPTAIALISPSAHPPKPLTEKSFKIANAQMLQFLPKVIEQTEPEAEPPKEMGRVIGHQHVRYAQHLQQPSPRRLVTKVHGNTLFATIQLLKEARVSSPPRAASRGFEFKNPGPEVP